MATFLPHRSVRATRRQLLLAWVALVLNAMAPVIAYAHLHVGAGGEFAEHCAADAGSTSTHVHVKPGRAVAHCVYCPGFAAGASLCAAAALMPPPSFAASSPVVVPPEHVGGRASLRIAPSRAPPAVART